MKKRWLAPYLNATMLFIFFFLLSLSVFMFETKQNAWLIPLTSFFLLSFFLVFTNMLSDFHHAQKPIQKFFRANNEKIISLVPAKEQTKIVTEDFNQLNQLTIEQTKITEPEYPKTINALTEKALFYKQHLGIDFVRNKNGLSKYHFDVESIGQSPFLFEFTIPKKYSSLLTPEELDEIAENLPEQVKGFGLEQMPGSVNVRIVIDEHTTQKDPNGVYTALKETKKRVSGV